MAKRTSSQPTLLNDQEESSTKDMTNQVSAEHKMTSKRTSANIDSKGKKETRRVKKQDVSGRKKSDFKKK